MKPRTLVVHILGHALKRYGYHLQKTTAPITHNPIDLFGLAAREVMHDKGALTFVQIGAHDGVGFDPIHDFVKAHGWTALLVEPQPTAFNLLQKNYAGHAGLLFERSAIGPGNGTLELFTFDPAANPSHHATMMASSSLAWLEEHRRLHGLQAPIISIQVPALTPTALLEKHDIESFDVLQIDAEGMDGVILSAFDFDRWKPSIIHFESAGLEPSERQSVFERLTSYGYGLADNYRLESGDTLAYRRPPHVSQ